jgi:hypothetical protein
MSTTYEQRQAAALMRLSQTRQALTQVDQTQAMPEMWANHQVTAIEAMGSLAAARVRGVVRRHPWACVAAGMAVGALLTHQRKKLLGVGVSATLPWLSGLAAEHALPLLQQWVGLAASTQDPAQSTEG